MKKLFQYAVLLHNHNDDGAYLDSEIIIHPSFRLAKTEKELLFAITREIPEKYVENPDNIQILVRNF